MFVINYKIIEESNCLGKGDEIEVKCFKEFGGGSDELSEDI